MALLGRVQNGFLGENYDARVSAVEVSGLVMYTEWKTKDFQEKNKFELIPYRKTKVCTPSYRDRWTTLTWESETNKHNGKNGVTSFEEFVVLLDAVLCSCALCYQGAQYVKVMYQKVGRFYLRRYYGCLLRSTAPVHCLH
jgi:hypothetical protein